MMLTHDEQSQPVAYFIDKNDRASVVPIVMDERVFSDTVLRVTQLSPTVFLVCDLRYLNGVCVFDTLSYSERQAKIETIIEMFHSPDLVALLTPDEMSLDIPIRGWETYDDMPGTLGVFLPVDE